MIGSIDTQVTAPTPQEIAETYGDFLRNPDAPRPEKPERPGKYFDAEAMQKEQRQWDNATAERQRLAAWVAGNKAERDAAEQQSRDEQAKTRADRTAAERVDLEAMLRRRFLAQPGVEVNDWERNKQRVIDDHLVGQAGVADDAARRSMAARYRDAF